MRPLDLGLASSRLVRLVLVLATLAALAAPARAFDIHRHAIMTRQVLMRHGVTGAAAALVAFGAMLPDLQGCVPNCYCDYAPQWCRPDSAHAIPFAVDHFDNDLFLESIDRVNANMDIARAGITSTPTQYRAAGTALLAFGRALHTTQDFYAHSTFVEINLFLYRRNPLNIPLWQGQPYAGFSWSTSDGVTGGGQLASGYYLQSGPFGSYTHGLISKDNAGKSIHGRVPVQISTPVSGNTTLYGLASGDFTNSMSFAEEGLAPRHTVFALGVLLNGGYVFPYVFANGKPPARPASPTAVQDFFDWVNANPDLIAMAASADSLVARADSLEAFPMGAIDAEGLPLPFPASVTPRTSDAVLLAAPVPNPSSGVATVRFVAPRAGRVSLRVFDLEGRLVASLFDADVVAGSHEARWDGRDADGRALPAGVYTVRMTGFGRSESRRIARVP